MNSSVSQVQHDEGAKFIQLKVPKDYEPALGCPSKMTNAYKTKEKDGDEDVCHRYTSMCLYNERLGVLPLDYIHYDLQQAVHLIGTGGKTSNILAAKVSFACKIFFDDKTSITKWFSFGLKFKDDNRTSCTLFSFDKMRNLWQF